MNPFSLDGRTALVTGANTGIGQAIAVALGRAGANVICAGRSSSAETLALAQGGAAKGDVMGVARLAGIMGAKRTSDLIPLCHPLPIAKVSVDLVADPALPGIRVTATVRTTGKTGVEMEALTAVSTACLTIYDMLKAAQKDMRIEGIRLLSKTGGKSGAFHAAP